MCLLKPKCAVVARFCGCAWVACSDLPVPVGPSWGILWLPSSGGCVLSAWCVPCYSSIPGIDVTIINPL